MSLGAPPLGKGRISAIHAPHTLSFATPSLKPGPRNQNSEFWREIGCRKWVTVMMVGEAKTAVKGEAGGEAVVSE